MRHACVGLALACAHLTLATACHSRRVEASASDERDAALTPSIASNSLSTRPPSFASAEAAPNAASPSADSFPPPSRYFGTWRISRFEHLGESAALTLRFAKTQVGKTMTLTNGELRFDRKLLWLGNASCKDARYSWEPDPDARGLLPRDHPSARPGDFLLLNFACGERKRGAVQVTKGDQLVVYYDNWFFFFVRADAVSR